MQFLLGLMQKSADEILQLGKGGLWFLPFVLILSSVGYYWTEAQGRPDLSYLDALWWSIVTMTTVGYGDEFPVTTAGRFLVAVPTMLVGIAALALLLDKVQSRLTEASLKRKGRVRMKKTDHLLILGSKDTNSMVDILTEIRSDRVYGQVPIALVSDRFNELPEEFEPLKVHFIQGNPAVPTSLNLANAAGCQRVLVMADEQNVDADGQTLIRLLNLKPFLEGRNVPVVAECSRMEYRPTFVGAGATEVITLQAFSSGLMAQSVCSGGLSEVLSELLSNSSGCEMLIDPLPEGLSSCDMGQLIDALNGLLPDVRILGVIQADRTLLTTRSAKLKYVASILYVAPDRISPSQWSQIAAGIH